MRRETVGRQNALLEDLPHVFVVGLMSDSGLRLCSTQNRGRVMGPYERSGLCTPIPGIYVSGWYTLTSTTRARGGHEPCASGSV